MPRMHFHIDVDEMQELWCEGMPPAAIGQRYSISTSSVWRLSHKYGFPDRDLPQSSEPPPPSPEDEAASGDSLRLSPWVSGRIKELGLGMPRDVA